MSVPSFVPTPASRTRWSVPVLEACPTKAPLSGSAASARARHPSRRPWHSMTPTVEAPSDADNFFPRWRNGARQDGAVPSGATAASSCLTADVEVDAEEEQGPEDDR